MSKRLAVSFFARKVEVVARELVGRLLVLEYRRRRIVGLIAETGAYEGEGRKGLEAAPGELYLPVFTGGQLILCIGTEAEGVKSVVTVRMLLPVEGFKEPALGASAVVATLGIDRSWNDKSVCGASADLWIEGTPGRGDRVVRIGPRDEQMADNCVAYFRLAAMHKPMAA